MGTSNVALPPMDKIFIIGIWTESVLYGMSSVISLDIFTDARILAGFK